jgi:hypothetical protein
MSTHGRETGFAPPYRGPLPQGRRKILGAGVVLAILMAIAALIVAILALTQEPPPAASATASAASPSPQGPTTDADRKLCQAIAPLMKENDDRSNAFLGTGDPGSPEQDAALPKFVTDTQDWAQRTQQVLDANANPPRLLTRTLQRYIDDMQLFVASVRPGPGTKYDEAAWTDGIVAYGGPLATCQALGVQW